QADQRGGAAGDDRRDADAAGIRGRVHATDARRRSLLMLYLDTSLLVAALTREAKTARVQAWLDDQEPAELAISEWVVTEFSAALSIKLRTREIEADDRADALAMFAGLCAENLAILPISGLHFRTAARFADQYAL